MRKMNFFHSHWVAVACLLCATILNVLPAYMWADPVMPGLNRLVTQPDGTQIRVFTHGDEYFHYETDAEGNVLERNERGFFVNTHEKMTPERARARRANSPAYAQGANPHRVVGHPAHPARVLVLLIQFPDTTFHQGNDTKEAWEEFFSKKGYDKDGAKGSVRDYFIEQSGGQYTPQFDIYGPITVSKEWEYYPSNDYTGTDSKIPSGNRVYDMIVEACTQLDDDIDFSKYDEDGDGDIDFIYALYAGYGYSSAYMGIWPHHSSGKHYSTTKGRLVTEKEKEEWVKKKALAKFDGKYFTMYSCSNEMRPGVTRTGIGTTVHETSHHLGLPDYYDTDGWDNYGKKNITLPYKYSLMSSGSHTNNGINPPNYSIYDKYYMGWLTPKVLKDDGNYVLEPGEGYCITRNGKLATATRQDTVYYIENRQATGWDEYLPGHGLLVWRVVYDQTIWEMNRPNATADMSRITVMPSYGTLEKMGPYEYKDSTAHYNRETYPGSHGISQTEEFFGNTLREITEEDGKISFSINQPISSILYKGDGYDFIYPQYGETYSIHCSWYGKQTGSISVQKRVLPSEKWVTVAAWYKTIKNRQYEYDYETTAGGEPEVKYRVVIEKAGVPDEEKMYVSDEMSVTTYYPLTVFKEDGTKVTKYYGYYEAKTTPWRFAVEECNKCRFVCSIGVRRWVDEKGWLLFEMPAAPLTIYYTPGNFNVRFLDYDGTLLDEQQVNCGGDAVPPVTPEHEGLIFRGWSKDYTNVRDHLSVQAIFAVKGAEIRMRMTEHTTEEPLTCSYSAFNRKTFESSQTSAMTGDKLTFSTFVKAPKSVRVYFETAVVYNNNTGYGEWMSATQGDAVLTDEEALEGKTITKTIRVMHDGNDGFGSNELMSEHKRAYRFRVSGNGVETMYSNIFELKTYYRTAIRFRKDMGFSLQAYTDDHFTESELVKEVGDYYVLTIPVSPDDTLRIQPAGADNNCFAFWRVIHPTWPLNNGLDSNGIPYIIGMEMSDTIEVSVPTYNVTFTYPRINPTTGRREFYNDVHQVPCGQGAVPPIVETDELVTSQSSVFSGWTSWMESEYGNDAYMSGVNRDMGFDAQFEYWDKITEFQVTFRGLNDEFIASQTVKEGEDAVLPEAPEHAGYTFVQWVGNYQFVTEDRIIRAEYSKDDTYWTVTFRTTFDGQTTELSQEKVKDGQSAVGEVPPHYEGYTFAGWDKDYSVVHSDLVVTGTYDETWFDIRFHTPQGVVTVPTRGDAIPVYTGEIPVKDCEKDKVYTFSGWTPEPEKAIGEADYTAVFDEHPRTYTVVFQNWDFTELVSRQVEYGKAAKEPATLPFRNGYTFTGWDTPFDKVMSDLTVTALFKLSPFVVRFLDEDDTELDSQEVEYGEAAIAPADPVREGRTFIGWDKEFCFITSDLTVKALFEPKNDTPTAIEDISINSKKAQKILHEGMLYIILPNGAIYNATGARVK